jgi:hypothetical protein
MRVSLVFFLLINLSIVRSKLFRNREIVHDDIEVQEVDEEGELELENGFTEEEEEEEEEEEGKEGDTDEFDEDGEYFYEESSQNGDYNNEEASDDSKHDKKSEHGSHQNQRDTIDNDAHDIADLSLLDSLLESANLQDSGYQSPPSTPNADAAPAAVNVLKGTDIGDKSSITIAHMKASLKKSGVSPAKLDNFLVLERAYVPLYFEN